MILAAEPGHAGGASPEMLGCRIYRDRGVIVVQFGEMGGFVLDVAAGLVEGRLVNPTTISPSIHVGILHFALCELLKRYGIYRIHAACVARNGTGYLFPGRSGSGKTTCCLALLRAGYGYLADDCTFLRRGLDGSEALCFPSSPKILDRTREIFPELACRSDPREVYSAQVVESCSPDFIVFPRITDCSRSRLEPLPRSQALGELLPQTLVISDRAIARAQTDVLSALVARARCYRLHFGSDAAALPDLVAELGGAA
ncbi:MAG TPA: hypothetical protein VN999_06855 [Thermoanaerobaculia bacterium]|nr:hypothetical protein [Thermoanaerobaculia bacterium]